MKEKIEHIIRFLKDNIEPIDDEHHGLSYRAAAYLTDGTYLPCVIFRDRQTFINRAFNELKIVFVGPRRMPIIRILEWLKIVPRGSKPICEKPPHQYFFVERNVAIGNRLDYWDIDKVEKSRFAFPGHILKQIDEMAFDTGSGFAAKMKDGKYVGFGTEGRNEFFSLPEEYAAEDIVEIINDCYVLEDGQISMRKRTSLDNEHLYKDTVFYREKPYFVCYVSDL